MADRTPRPCDTCGLIFTPRRPGGKAGRAGTRWGVFCGKACQSLGQRRATPAKPEVAPAECVVCRSTFTAKPQRLTCTAACAAQRARDKAREAAVERAPKTHRSCGECGITFLPEYGTKLRAYCSAACRRRAVRRAAKAIRRARQRGAKVEVVRSTDVFERDAWRCHLCCRKTIAAKRGTAHPRAPELDHIVPLALGGAHSYANTACACRECNWRKGATARGQPSLFTGPAAR